MKYKSKKRCKPVEPTSLSYYIIATMNKFYYIATSENNQVIKGGLLYELQKQF